MAMKLSLGTAVFVAALAGATVGNAQGFDCRRAHFPDEKLVCQEPALALLDEQLNAIFRRVMGRLSPQERVSLDQEETGWVLTRRRCGRSYACIEQQYRRRLAELSAMSPETGSRPDEAAEDPRPAGKSRQSARIDRPARPKLAASVAPQ